MAFHFKSLIAAAAIGGGLAGCADISADAGTETIILANKAITIQNNTGQTMIRFFGSPTISNNWEEDIFGVGVLAAGDTQIIDFTDGRETCEYDLRADLRDGTSLVMNNIDVCEAEVIAFP